jgi:AAA ATPase domain
VINMARPLVIAHAKGEDDLAERLAAPLREAGYAVVHQGTVLVGGSVLEEVSKVLQAGAPVVLCGTIKAVGTQWARQVVNAAHGYGPGRVFAVQMEEEAYVEPLAFDTVVASYWQDPGKAIGDLLTALRKQYPPEPDEGAALASSLGAISGDKVEWLIAEYTDGVFVGRDEVMDRLDAFVSRQRSGCLAVTAKAGYGKTALLANWLARRRDGADPFFAYHFFRRNDDDTRTVEEACRNLIRQLHAYPGAWDGAEGTSVVTTRERLYSFVKRQGGRERRLVIVIDALDEADGHSSFRFSFPDPLPDGVLAVVSARAEENEAPAYLADWLPSAERIHLHRLPRAAVAEWLRRCSGERLGEFVGRQDFVDLVSDRTEGLPLYIHYLVDELTNAPWADTEPHRIVEATPRGFTAYLKKQYEQLLADLRDGGDANWEEQCWRFLALLSVAKGPLRGPELLELTERNLRARHLSQLRNSWQVSRWLRSLEQDDTWSFAFEQPVLAEEFARAYADDAEVALGRLLEWCARSERSEYALRHYAEHLLDTIPDQGEDLPPPPERAALYSLAGNRSFLEAQSLRFPREPDLPLRTIQAAIQAAAKTDDAAGMASFLLIHLRHFLEVGERQSPVDALEAFGPERAWTLADLVDIERCVLWHLLLSWILAETAPRDAAATLRRLRERELPQLSGQHAQLAAFMLVQVAAVDEDAVAMLLRRCLAETDRIDVLAQLLSNPPQRGRPAAAGDNPPPDAATSVWLRAVRSATEAVGDPTQRNFALAVAARAAAELGDPDAARALLGRVAGDGEPAPIDSSDRAAILARVAQCHAALGDLDAARQVIGRVEAVIERIPQSAVAVRSIAVAQAMTGDVEAATRTAERIEVPEEKVNALLEIARREAAAGDDRASATFELARNAARAIAVRDEWQAAQTTFATALEPAKPEEPPPEGFIAAVARALNVVNELKDWTRKYVEARGDADRGSTSLHLRAAAVGIATPEERLPFLNAIAQTQAESGQADEAARTFGLAAGQALKGHEEGAAGLLVLAWAQATIGWSQESAASFELARKAAGALTDSAARAEVIGTICRLQAEAGQFDAAGEAALRLDQAHARADVLANIAWQQHQAGQAEQAMPTFVASQEAAMAIDDPRVRSSVLSTIAVVQVRAGHAENGVSTFELAREAASSLPDAATRAEVIGEICRSQAQAGQVDAAREAALGVEDPQARAKALVPIALAQNDAGRRQDAASTFELARAAAEEIANAQERAMVLAAIGQIQVEAGHGEDGARTFEAAEAAARTGDAVTAGGLLAILSEMRLRLGQFDAGRTTASSIENAEYRALTLIRVADAEARGGHTDQAATTLWTAYQASKEVADLVDRAGAMAAVAVALAELGAPEASPHPRSPAAERVEAAEARALELLAAALVQRRTGAETAREAFAAAKAAAEAIAEPADRTALLETITLLLTEGPGGQDPQRRGQTPDAEVTRLQLRRTDVLLSIARAESEDGRSEQATATFRAAQEATSGISDAGMRARSLTGIARACAEAGQLEEAAATLEKAQTAAAQVENPQSRAFVLSEIAVERARNRPVAELASAVEAARSLPDAEARVVALAGIGQVQAQAGDRAAARRTWDLARASARTLASQADALELLALRQIQSRDWETAWQTTQDLRSFRSRQRLEGVGLRIVKAQAAAGEAGAAQETIARLLVPPAVDHRELAMWALASIARVVAGFGTSDDAAEAAGWIEDDAVREATLAELAQVGGQRNQVPTATPQAWPATAHGADVLVDSRTSQDGIGQALRAAQGIGERAAPIVMPSTLPKDSNRRLQDEAVARAEAAVVDVRERSGFERLLVPSAYFPEATYRLLPLMAAVYSRQWRGVARAVREFLSSSGPDRQAGHDPA